MSTHAPTDIAPLWIEVDEYRHPAGWMELLEAQAREHCRQLERGEILFFHGIPYGLPQEEIEFLRGQRRGDSRLHKNVSYRPVEDVLRGADGDAEVRDRTHRTLRGYSERVARFAAA